VKLWLLLFTAAGGTALKIVGIPLIQYCLPPPATIAVPKKHDFFEDPRIEDSGLASSPRILRLNQTIRILF